MSSNRVYFDARTYHLSCWSFSFLNGTSVQKCRKSTPLSVCSSEFIVCLKTIYTPPRCTYVIFYINNYLYLISINNDLCFSDNDREATFECLSRCIQWIIVYVSSTVVMEYFITLNIKFNYSDKYTTTMK